jgi:membrane-bound ClpP family serine protease
MWLIIALLIVTGLILLIIEVVFIPGTTVVGIFGVLLAAAGIVFGYVDYGSTVGTYILLSTGILTSIMLYLSFRSGAWKRFALNTAIESKFNEGLSAQFQVGEEGLAVSALRPIGKAEFAGKQIEVTSADGSYVDTGVKVRIKEVSDSAIIVEQIV